MSSSACRILSVLLVSLAALGASASTAARTCGYGQASAEVCGVDHTVTRGQAFTLDVADLSIDTDLAHWTSATIDWGDGTSENLNGEEGTHTYARAGTFVFSVTGYGRGTPPWDDLTGRRRGRAW